MKTLNQNFMVGALTFLNNNQFNCNSGCGCDDPNNCSEGCDGTGCGCDDPGGTFECCGCDDDCTYDASL